MKTNAIVPSLARVALVTCVIFTIALAARYLDPAHYDDFFGARDPDHDRIYISAAHIGGGVVALVAGVTQYLRVGHGGLPHRIVGRLYVGSVAISALAGLIMAPYSMGEWPNALGFTLLSAFWLASTWLGWHSARRHVVAQHRAWMARSFALTLAGVTLRGELLVLIAFVGLSFETAYAIVAWSAWVLNLLACEYWLRLCRKRLLVRKSL